MAPEVLTGIFTGIGALIGFLGTSITALLTTRSQREQRQETQAERVYEVRREAYGSALAAVVTFMAIARELNDRISEDYDLDTTRALFGEYNATWRKVVEAVSKVEVIGPPDVSSHALVFRRSVDTYRFTLDLRYSKFAKCDDPATVARLEDGLFDCYATYQAERRKFIELSQEYSTIPIR